MPEFLSLAQILRPQRPDPPAGAAPVVEACVSAKVPPSSEEDREDRLRDVRFFQAHLSEALEVAVAFLLEKIAREVLARELALAPAHTSKIVSDALERYRQSEPLRVRVHSADLDALAEIDVPVFGEDSLERGDAIVELRDGSIELFLQTRLEEVLGTMIW
jgi:flagellar biosynthesis/type III secretory pathway protein FliH